METVDRFSATSSTASSVNESPRPSRSTRLSASDVRSHHGNTPASSTVATPEAKLANTNDVEGTMNANLVETVSACSENSENWYQRHPEYLEYSAASHSLPTQAQLDAAGEVTIYDGEGNSRPFRHLYQGPEHRGQQQMIIFVRHFYCSVCQSYIKALVDTITPTRYFSIPTSTTITIIGCGRPYLLPKYADRTLCPFRIYSDPTRNLYRALGLNRIWLPGKRSKYNCDSVPKILKDSFGQMVEAGRQDAVRGGNMFQSGGEFLFRQGKCVWSHRMKTARDHVEVNVLDKILEATDEELQRLNFSFRGSLPNTLKSSSTKSPQDESKQLRTPRPTPRGGMKLVWEDRGEFEAPRARLQRQEDA